MNVRHPAGPSSAPAEVEAAPGRTRLGRATALLPGLVPVVALTALATLLGHLAPVVGPPVFAVVGGIGIALIRPPAERARPGLNFAAKTVLKTSIVVLGTGLSFHEVLTIGSASLPVLLGTLAVALLGAVVIGRALGVARDLRTLIGVGTGICGASAIAATDAVISASDADVSYAIATIFTFNVAAVLTFPSIGHALGLSPHAFGLWAGTAVNDLSSVVAASTIFGHGAATYAVVVKLTRTLMIIPIAIALSAWRARAGRPRTTANGPETDQLAPGPVGHRRRHDHDGTGRHRPVHPATGDPPSRVPAPRSRCHPVGPRGLDQLGAPGADRHSRVTTRGERGGSASPRCKSPSVRVGGGQPGGRGVSALVPCQSCAMSVASRARW